MDGRVGSKVGRIMSVQRRVCYCGCGGIFERAYSCYWVVKDIPLASTVTIRKGE